jgi:hypothetical protein
MSRKFTRRRRSGPARLLLTYLQLSEAYQDEATKARELGWPMAERPSHHLAPLTDPALVAESLRQLLGQLVAQQGHSGAEDVGEGPGEPH